MDNRYIVGVADSEVTGVAVVSEAGVSRDVELNSSRAFLYPVPRGELQLGIEPAAVVVRGASGKVAERIPVE